MDRSAAVVVGGLTKSYGPVVAVAGVDLRIEHGKVLVSPSAR